MAQPEPTHDPQPPDPAPTGAGTVLVVGEALVDVVHTHDGDVAEHVGGSPANVALTLGRLGRDAVLLTHLADDERGRRVAGHLGASGVRLAEGSTTAARTASAVATLDPSGAATYTFDIVWDLPGAEPPVAAPLAVHTGSIAAVLAPGAAVVHELVARLRPTSTVSYDPNLRPALMGSPEAVRGTVESLVAASDVVKLSDEDAAWLAPEVTVDELAARWLALGPAVVVVTLGARGALARCADGVVEVPGVPVDVADTVGAGDSFSGALVDALWSRDLLGAGARDRLHAVDAATLRDVVRQAVAVAAVTVSRPGADPPTRPELDARG